MKYRLIILFSVASFSASAQWLNISFKKKHLILPAIHMAKGLAFNKAAVKATINPVDVETYTLNESLYTLEAREAVILKTVKHNMSWRIYGLASYNFSDLAQVYIQMHRLSEAKWYLLQSNNLSRQQNDDKHTIANLMDLAMVKTDIGDPVSARADLVEAHDLANVRGMKEKAEEIDKKIQLIDQNKSASSAKYAEASAASKKDL